MRVLGQQKWTQVTAVSRRILKEALSGNERRNKVGKDKEGRHQEQEEAEISQNSLVNKYGW